MDVCMHMKPKNTWRPENNSMELMLSFTVLWVWKSKLRSLDLEGQQSCQPPLISYTTVTRVKATLSI